MKRFCWFLAFVPPVMVESSLRGSVTIKSSGASLKNGTSSSSCPADCSQLHGQRDACHACPTCQWYQRTSECQAFQFKAAHAHHTAHLASTTATTPTTTKELEEAIPDHFCGCASCTREIWDRDANGFSCGFRIRYYTTGHGGNHTMEQACSRVATRYDSCMPCMPHVCGRDWETLRNHHKAQEALVHGAPGSTH